MISQTPFSVQIELIDNAVDQIKDHDVFTINEPTGDFFYDQWKIKNELQGTIWEELYNSLPVHNKGEARIIKLAGNESYFSHGCPCGGSAVSTNSSQWFVGRTSRSIGMIS